MSWLRAGDQAAFYPPLMLTATLGDERTVNEVSGWIHRCMEQSAGHRTDYLVDMGTATSLGGSRTAELIRICKKVKLLKVVKRGGLEYIDIVRDPAFLHVRLRREQEWEAQRKRDNGNGGLTARVRLRDGDACRWCGIVVYFGTADQWSKRVGTYDHLDPPADLTEIRPASMDEMVVACRECNSARRNNRDSFARQLMDPPAPPYYSAASAAFIAKHLGITVISDPGDQPRPDQASEPAAAARTNPPRPARKVDPAAVSPPRPDVESDPAAASPRPGTPDPAASATPAATTRPDAGPRSGEPSRPRSAEIDPPVSGNPGTGRDGSGWVGSGRDPARRRRRASRSNREGT